MDQSLYVDPDGLRGSADELDVLAAETAQLLAQLKADLAEEGECWGDDKPGKMFAESYVPSMERSMEGFENLVQNVSALGANLRTTAENFESQDREAADNVQNSWPDSAFPDLSMPGIAGPATAPPGGTAYRGRRTADPLGTSRPSASGEPVRRSPTAQQRPVGPGQSEPGSPVVGEADTPQTAGQHSSDAPAATAPPGADAGSAPDNAQPSGSGSPEQGNVTEQSSSQSPLAGSPNSPAAPPSRSAAAPSSSPPASPTDRRPDTPPAGTPSSRTPVGPRVSAPAQPGAPGNPASPWSKPGSATAPEQQHAPPRPTPPRRPEPAKAPEPEQRKKPEPPRQPVTSDEAMRILMAMAARHNLQISGFESSGIAVSVARDIADAVDAVLDKYPLPLHGIEVGDTGDEKATVANRGAPQAPEAWIVLDRSVIAKPDDPGGVLPWTQQTDTADRPVYIRMLRAFGQVVDLAGGFRARHTAQRALITEYLRITGTDNRSMSHVVAGYRRWRDQLDETCFRDGGVDPGRALAWGFTEVEQGGVRASGPAKVLHRLLLVMARLDMRQGSRTP